MAKSKVEIAEEKANNLLLAHLDPGQQQQWAEGYIDVHTKDGDFRIMTVRNQKAGQHIHGPTVIFAPQDYRNSYDNTERTVVGKYVFLPLGYYEGVDAPLPDHVLALKVMLEVQPWETYVTGCANAYERKHIFPPKEEPADVLF